MQQKVLIFRGQICACFGQEDCLKAVETDVPIKVGKPEFNIAALTAEFTEELFGTARRTCSILVSQISTLSLLELI